MNRKTIALLGSTGSIGVSSLDLIERFPGRFKVATLAAGRNVEVLADQVRRFRPAVVSVAPEVLAGRLGSLLGDRSTWGAPAASAWDQGAPRILWGNEGLLACAAHSEVEIVLAGIVGAAGLAPTFEAVKLGRVVALANKEALVVAGSLMTSRARETGATLLPVDSEHNALHQCLRAGTGEEVARLILTASGGPFFGSSRSDLGNATLERALKHPTWRMGRKITIDSATLMNKGLEVIEAHFLFGVPREKIEVVIHPQSIVHSMVEYVDGAFICQMSRSDMRHPIQYALTWPERWLSPLPGLDLRAMGPLTFHAPDTATFRCLDLGYAALGAGGTMPAVLNAANEVAVAAFLDRRLEFLDIPRVIENVMDRHGTERTPDLETVLRADAWAREAATETIGAAPTAGRRPTS
jgi:1-deoxy-D-xylulose-5-phosphate reductoisomerase